MELASVLNCSSLCRSCSVRSSDSLLEFAIEPLKLPRLPMEFGEDADLRPQELRDDGDGDVVDCTALVALDAIRIGEMNGGDEDDGGFLEARVAVHHIRQLKTVDLRHADVHQHYSDIIAEQLLHGLTCRSGLDQVFAQLTEDHFIAEQLARLIIDHEYVGSIAFVHGPFLLPNFLGTVANLRCRLEHFR